MFREIENSYSTEHICESLNILLFEFFEEKNLNYTFGQKHRYGTCSGNGGDLENRVVFYLLCNEFG